MPVKTIKQAHKPLVFIKMLILAVVLLFPLMLIVYFGLTNNYLVNNVLNSQKHLANKNQPETTATNSGVNYNFNAPLLAEQAGKIAEVPKDKIDSLFDNLKNK